MLSVDTTIFACIDIQENLARAMCDRERLVTNSRKLIAGLGVLGVPMLWTEQNPERLGATLPEIAEVISAGVRPCSKMSFSCCGAESFVQSLKQRGRMQVVLAGIETHVCVYQTAAELLEMGYGVHVAADCVCSRTAENNATGIERMRSAGAQVTSAETVLFELLRTAAAPQFRQISKIVK